ncbi:Uncharacterized protein FKW44_017377, partial [Caligus rogercresseyi]
PFPLEAEEAVSSTQPLLVNEDASGDPINYCENTIAATRSAIASGANAIEIDLSISEDGVIFLWHDPNPWNILSLIR